jgi:hypothetical protein
MYGICFFHQIFFLPFYMSWYKNSNTVRLVLRGHHWNTGLTLDGDLGEEVTLWLLTSLCTSAKREVEVAL